MIDQDVLLVGGVDVAAVDRAIELLGRGFASRFVSDYEDESGLPSISGLPIGIDVLGDAQGEVAEQLARSLQDAGARVVWLRAGRLVADLA